MAGNIYNEVSSLKLGKHKKDKNAKKTNEISPFSRSSASETASSASLTSTTGVSSSTTNTNEQWPPSLNQFVNECYQRSNTLSESEKVQFNEQIQQILLKALDEGKLWENNWQLQKLPVFEGVKLPVELECNTRVDVEPIPSSTKMLPTKNKKSNKRTNDLLSDFKSDERKKQRMARFSDSLTPEPVGKKALSIDRKGEPIKGTCQDLEKNYLRLTSEPEPSRVRPQKVLEKSLEYVLNKYLKEGAPYSYLNNQFKSIRQDLTVQHIKNELTLKVYESHARIAIENNDLGEFNQCQSQLKYLYYIHKQKQAGIDNEKFNENDLEFTFYRILYMLMMGNYPEIFKIRYEIYFKKDFENYGKKNELKIFNCIEKSFDLQNFQVLGDYHNFFKIYKEFRSIDLNLGFHLIKNFLINKERIKALNIISKTYRKISISFLIDELAFRTSENHDEEDIFDFFKRHNLIQFAKDNDFDCASARGIVQGITVQTGFRKIDIKGQV